MQPTTIRRRPGRRKSPVRTFFETFGAALGSPSPTALAIYHRQCIAEQCPKSGADVQEAVDACAEFLFGLAAPTIETAVRTTTRLACLTVTRVATPRDEPEFDIKRVTSTATLSEVVHRGLVGAALGRSAITLTRVSLSQHHPSAEIHWIDSTGQLHLHLFGEDRHNLVDVRFEIGPMALARLAGVIGAFHIVGDAFRASGATR